MPRRKMIFLSLAIVIGLGTMMMMRIALNHKSNQAAAAPITQIMVAATDIGTGQLLQPQQIRWQEWAPDHLTEALIVKDEPVTPQEGKGRLVQAPANPADDFMGAVVRQSIKAGEPILKGALVKPHDRGFLAAVLEPGKRAVAVPLTNVTGIAGFVFPGDHVDLILTHAIRGNEEDKINERRASVTIVKDLRVLALDHNTDMGATQPGQPDVKQEVREAKVVTVEVSPKQAEIVTLALQLGTLSLSLRSLATEESTNVADNGNVLAQPIGYAPHGSAYTLDSEVSNIIPRPQDRRNVDSQLVQVLRGSSARQQENFVKDQTQN